MAKEDITEALEAMIDRHGLLHVITGLGLVCGEKAEHIRQNWQDSSTAKAWDGEANRLLALARKVKV